MPERRRIFLGRGGENAGLPKITGNGQEIINTVERCAICRSGREFFREDLPRIMDNLEITSIGG
jgi:hypothetical protein